MTMKRNPKKKRIHRTANPEYIAAMRQLRRSSAAGTHTDKHAERRKGHNARGGRAGARAQWRKNPET